MAKQLDSPRIEWFTNEGTLSLTRTGSTLRSRRDSSPSTVSSADTGSDVEWYEPYGAVPSSPAEFEQNFPSRQKLRIHHDDSTSDGNMNLRVDVLDCTARQLTLFHLRMHDLQARKFSLRRHGRDSGREICRSGRRVSRHSDSQALLGALRQFRLTKDHLPLCDKKQPEAISLQFSNYAEVDVRCRDSEAKRRYQFEYWGMTYEWKRHIHRIGRHEVKSFHLMNKTSAKSIAHITPDFLTAAEAQEERNRGGWVPACTLQITDRKVFRGLTNIAEYGSLLSECD